MNKPLNPAAAELAAIAGRPFDDAVAMPPSVYRSRDFLELEQENIFRRQWICVGRESLLARAGDYVTEDIAGQPVVVLRDREGGLRAYSNVCRHRMAVLLEGAGHAQALSCPYHAWTYGLDGRLIGAPHMQKSPGFCKDDYALPPLRVEAWQGWVYVSLDPGIAPVAETLSDLTALIARYRMGDYVETFRESHVWDTNWKILAENFMESYHLPVLHRKTVGTHSRMEEVETPPGLPAFNYHWFTKEASLALGQAHPDNRHLDGHWRKTSCLMAIYPNHLVTLTPGYFWYLVLHPAGVDKVRMLFGGGFAPEFMTDPKAGEYTASLKSLLDTVNEEDRLGVESVYRGLNAPLAAPGHLSSLERPLYDFARYLAGRTGA